MDKQNVKSYFDSHPKVNKLFFTSDGQAFFLEDHADAQAVALKRDGKDDKVHAVTREELNEQLTVNIEQLVGETFLSVLRAAGNPASEGGSEEPGEVKPKKVAKKTAEKTEAGTDQ